jgi:hypothetical protein
MADSSMRTKRDMSIALLLLGIGWRASVAGATDLDLGPFPAGSQERIVVVGTLEDHSFIGRVAAELRATKMDGDLRIVESDGSVLGYEIDLALKSGARAIVHPDSRLGRIELLIADPVAGRVTLRMSLSGSPMPTVEPVLALRAVEFVRAMLLGTPLVLPPLIAQLTPAEPARRWVASAVISFGAAWAGGGLPAQGELGAQLRIASPRSLGFSLFVLAPVTSASVEGVAATNARASIWLGGGDLFFRRAFGRRTSLDLGIGGLAIAMRVAGDPNAGWAGTSTTALGFGGYGHLGGSISLTSILTARADIVAGSTFRRPVASAGGPGIYPWGYAFATALAGIEFRLF